jgi:hypothetical protein
MLSILLIFALLYFGTTALFYSMFRIWAPSATAWQDLSYAAYWPIGFADHFVRKLL